MSEGTTKNCSEEEIIAKATHAIEQRKPFILIVTDSNGEECEVFRHVGDGSEKERDKNTRALLAAGLEFAKRNLIPYLSIAGIRKLLAGTEGEEQ